MCLSLLWGYLGFVQGIMNGLCWLQLQPVTSHSSSQSMCSTSFEWHIVFWVHNAAILPSHDSKALKTEPEMRKHTGRAGVKVQSALFLLFPFFFDTLQGPGRLICTGVWMEGEKRDGRRRGSRRKGGREGCMAGAAELGEVPDHCWSQEQDWLGLCVCVSLCVCRHTHTSISRMNRHIDVIDLRQNTLQCQLQQTLVALH